MSQINNLFVQRNGIGSQYPLSSYDPAQDVTPNGFAITQNQTQLELKGNTWKKVDFGNNYTITANTILEFDFQSTIEGEVHGIGLDNDNSVSLNWLFRLSGTQALGLGNFDNYVTGSGWKTYKIPVGNFFTGNFRYLIFSNDHDVTSPTGNGQFRNLRIYENNGVTAVNILPINPVQGEGNTGTSPFTFTVTRSGNTTGTSTVNWSVTGMGDNPATGADFGGTLPSGTVTFTAGQTTKQITVSVSGDISYEADEAFRVTLSNPVGAIINTNTAEGTILNDDAPPPTLDIAPLNAVQGEGDTGTTPFTFTVTRSGDTTGTSTVNWAVTLSGGADAADFGGTLPSGTVTFTPGETTKEIIVDVSGDISHEADEGFSVTLSDAVDAIINTDTAEGIILNDDVPATLDIAPLNAVQGEGNTGTTPFTFTVTRSGDTTGTSSVNWAVTLSGGADAADFSLTPATNNSQRETTTPSSPYAPNRLIVKFNPEVTSTQANEIKNSLGVVKTQNIRLTGAEIWELSGTTSVETALATYGRSRVFEYIEPDYIVTTAATIPNDPSFNLLWGLHNTGQTGGTPDADIDAPEAWDIQTGNPDLVIGVIDTGVDYTHPDLVGNIWTNTGEIAGDGIDNDGNGYIDDIRGWDFAYNDNNPMDVHGHGTHVSGTIAGKGNNAVGVTGVAWNAKIMPLKFLDDTGSGSTSNAILAVEYATAQGVKLTNNSWGGGGYSQGLYDAIAAAGDAGSLFIAAAGNSSNNNDSSPSYPASYNLDNIISVASTTHTDALSSFSNYGLTTVDLGAPGSDIYSTVPGNSYDSYSGTSMASPHVAGAAALLWSENPTWTAQQVKDVLLQTVDPIASLNGITVSGGRLNVYNALLSDPGFVISVTVSPASVAEDGSENLVYTFTRIGESLDSPLTVNFSASGTANAVAVGTDPADYTVVTNSDVTFDPATQTGTVTFAANADSVAVVVDPITDSLEENPETVQLSVNPGEGYIGSSAATGTIVSEETLPTFTNPNPIYIIGGGGNPYPATISVSGLSGEVTNVTVTLTNLAHTWPDDIDVLLVGPTGATTILMSDVGYNFGISNTTLTFDAGATAYLPAYTQITSGTYLPTNIGTGDNFAGPAPGGSHGTDLSVFNNTDPNGLWNLYVMDDFPALDSGSIAGGWSLLIETATTTTLPSGTVEFAPGETTKEIIVDVSGDISHEADEGFSVTLSDAEDAIINTDTAEGIILNDDVPATLDIAPLNAVQGEGDTGTTPFTFTVTRSGDTTGTSTVNWAVTLSGGADAADFSLTPATNNSQRETTTPSRPYAPNQLIVKLNPESTIAQVDEIKNSLGVVKTENIRLTGAEIWELSGTTSVETALATYGRSQVFEYIEPNQEVRLTDTVTSPSQTADYAPNRLIVKFNPEVTSTQANEIKNSLGVVKTQNIRLTGAEIWELSGTTSVETALATYGRSRVFEYIEPDYIVTTAATIPNDAGFNLLWGLHNTGQTGGTPDVDIDAPEAWDIQTGNPDLVIGVIDTGVDYTHPDLVGNIWTNTGEIAGNGIDDDGNGYIDDIRGWDFAYNDNNPMDVDGHGTHVSGTIAGKGNNAVGVTGVAWNAKIMPLKFLDDTGSGWISDAILAVEYATAQGVKLTNNSWGGGGYSQGLYDAIAAAGDAGSLFIAAAGNESNNNDSSPSYPASYNLDNIISVAAITHWDGLSSFSNYGLTTVDLGAPGSDIYSTVPGNSYDTYSGTSMASPHVAGAAALLWSENPTWTAQQVKDVLLQTVDPTETLNGITVSGGRLNVYNALLATTTTLPSGTVEFAPGETTKEITVYVSGDTDLEADEGFSVTLSDAVDAIINTDTAEGIILNDDSDVLPSTLDIAPLNAVQGEGDTGTTPFTFTVTRSGDTTVTSSVNWAVTLSGGADAADFSLIPAFINTADGLREIVGSGINPAGVDFSPTSRPTITPTSNPSIINAIDTGWYDSTGWHVGGHTNYALGGFYLWNSYYRNWIAFDLPTFTTPVTAAQLQIKTYDYNSSHDLSETYELRDVTTPISTLRAGGEGLTSIYDDLGDGTVYGSRDFSPGDSYTTVTIDLNSSLVNALNAKGGQQFALGGQITTLDGIDNNEFIFGSSGGYYPGDDVQLLLTYGNPLPSGTVEFAPGETTKEITVYVNGDISYETDEGFSVTLSDAEDAIINTDTAEGIILNDDTAIDNAQKITSSSNISAAPGGTVTIPLYYDTTTGDNSLPGISLRLHYNSSELTFNNASDLFLTNLFGDVKDLPDNGNFDSDVITDRFLQLQYNDFTGNWPNQPLPLKLADFKFTTTDSFTGTQVNFSSSNTAAGYGLAANSVTVSQGWNLDIDGSGEIKALSDGVILMRHLFGSFIGNDLIDGAIDPNATRDLVAIQAYLQEGVNQGHLDIDGNGSVGAYSDGIMAVRYMFGTFPGDALIHEVLSPDATRDLAQIQNHLEQLTTLV